MIFEADTPAGKAFDVALLVLIVASVLAVMLESVASVREHYGAVLRGFEWLVTILFTIEYALRLYSVGRPLAYARSFFGVVDLLTILPSYLSLVFTGAQSLLVIRALRLLRVFRVLKLVRFVGEASQLREALHASARKIAIFIGASPDRSPHRRRPYLSHRRGREWLHEHPPGHVLGHRDDDDRGLWRCLAANGLGKVPRHRHHDPWLRHHCCTDGNRKRRDARGFEANHQYPGLSELFQRGTRCGRHVLQELRHAFVAFIRKGIPLASIHLVGVR